MQSFQIGNRLIGHDHPPFIILEAGINHNGDLSLAKEMIRVAKAAGADAIKFQTFKADQFVADPGQMFTYHSQGRQVTESMLEMFRRYEFKRDQWVELKSACEREGIRFLSTPQNEVDLELLNELGIEAIKVGSDDFTNLPLLRRFAESGLPLILSCGMSDLAETHRALEAVGAFSGYPTALLVCTSEYPTPAEHANISRLNTLSGAFREKCVLGFSDHTIGNEAAVMAVALGGNLFEKHFTLDHELPGPDHWFSCNPEESVSWIQSIRKAHLMYGSGLVVPTEVERENKKEFQRVIVAAKTILKGDLLQPNNLTTRRIPGGVGWPPSFMDYIVGHPAHRDFSYLEPIGL